MQKKDTTLFYKGSLPILILAGVVLFVALILEILRLAFFSEPSPKRSSLLYQKAPAVNENVFENIHKKYPSYKDLPSQLIQQDVEFFSHNYVIGNPKAKVKVVMFNDNACNLCRKEGQRIVKELRPYLGDIALVYKNMPKSQKFDDLAAIFGQMAIHKGVYEQFLEGLPSLGGKGDNIAESYMLLLDKIGVGLLEQRHIMIDDMANILKEVQEDIQQAVQLNAYKAHDLPVVYVNGYQLGQKYLPVHKLTTYIERLIEGEFIIPKDMHKEEKAAYDAAYEAQMKKIGR